jgi:hypothetical protein
VAAAFEFRMKTSNEVEAFKGRHRRGTNCESVCARAFFYDDKRPANVAAGSNGIGNFELAVAVERANAGGACVTKPWR